MKYLIALLAIVLILSSGCATRDPLEGYCDEGERPMVICRPIDNLVDPIDDETDIVDEIVDDEIIDEEILEEEKELPQYRPEVEHAIVRVYEEGDVVSFSDIQAVDPDGRDVQITFGYPLNESGEWQTREGHAGQYTIEIRAFDGIDETVAYVLVVINVRNTPPEIIINDTFTVLEGEEVFLDVRVIDPDDDDIQITFSGWMTSPRYQTTFGDAGTHTVTITASDGIDVVSKDVTVVVIHVNRPPVIEVPDYDIIALEGELIELEINAFDPDGDDVILSFSEPFDNQGRWQTARGDAGTYNVIISASDGQERTSISLPVVVERVNTPPVLIVPEVIEVDEGETVFIEVDAFDPDGDEVTITFSGWMTSDTYTTNFDDAGTYTVTVTASDGFEEVSKEVTIIVNEVNRPPVFIWD